MSYRNKKDPRKCERRTTLWEWAEPRLVHACTAIPSVLYAAVMIPVLWIATVEPPVYLVAVCIALGTTFASGIATDFQSPMPRSVSWVLLSVSATAIYGAAVGLFSLWAYAFQVAS